jgi:hypothetical protein
VRVRRDNVGHHNTRALEPGRRSLVGIANGVFHDIDKVTLEPEMKEAYTMLGRIIASTTCMKVGEQERRRRESSLPLLGSYGAIFISDHSDHVSLQKNRDILLVDPVSRLLLRAQKIRMIQGPG